MPRTGISTPFTLRLTPAVETALESVSTQLGLDRSSTIRFLIMQKARELGVAQGGKPRAVAPEPAPPVAPASGARRAKRKS